MTHFGVGIEYALHVLTQLARFQPRKPPSARALAEFQGVPTAYLAKVMSSLEKAGIVEASEGKGGGYRLARPPESITFLDVADAIEGRKPLFECTEVRRRCVLYGGRPPAYVTANTCAIHAVMIAAEERMREKLTAVTLADIARPLAAKTSPETNQQALEWFANHPRRSPAGKKTRRPLSRKG